MMNRNKTYCCSFLSYCCCCCSKNNKEAEEIVLTGMAINSEFELGNTVTNSKIDEVNDILIAKYNNNSDSTCIQVKRNDRFSIFEDDNPNLNLVKNMENNVARYVPVNTSVQESSLLRQEWYFGDVTRMEAENSLLLPHHVDGTFLIRNAQKDKKFPFVLSIKYSTQNGHVKHYRIYEEDSSKEYYISEGLSFPSLAELVECYKDNKLLCVQLLSGCVLSGSEVEAISPNYEQWEIPKTEINVSKDRKLGHGQYSVVFHGAWNFTDVAVKMIKDENNVKEILKEVDIMKKLKHKNLITLYGVCTKSKPFWIIQEYLHHGDLYTYIKKTNLRNGQNMYISYQIADGMSYLESKNIVHRDLAARNILLGKNGLVKIADLGLSRKTDDDGNYVITSELKLPIRWMSPESFSTSTCSSKCDVWSFAILLIEIYTNGAKPYPGLSNQDVVVKVQRGYRIPKPEKMPRNVYKIVCKCWNQNPNKRPTFEELKQTFEVLYEEYEEP